MPRFSVILSAVLIALSMMFWSVAAQAQAFSVTKISDMDMGTSFAPATFVGTYYNLIGTNGTLQYAAGYSGPATATPGQLRINGPVGTTVEVSCETSNNMKNNTGCCGNATRSEDQNRFVIGTANAVGPGLGNLCAGLGTTPVEHTITGNAAQDTILLGMRLNVTNVRIGGQYVTTIGGSSPLTVRVRKTSGGVSTINTDVNLFASFDSSIAFSATQNMLFGTVSFAPPLLGTARANLATNNSLTYAGGLSGGVTGTAGFATITGVENSVVLEIYCDTTATMTRSGGGSIQVTNLEVDPEDSRGAIGTGTACAGIGSPATTFTYTSPTRDTIYIGGRINGSTAVSFGNGGSFSTANAGGNNVEVIILNQ